MSWKGFFGGGDSNIPWKEMTNESQIDEILKASRTKAQLIFKHSTRCSISSMAKSRLEREWNLEHVEPWYLDLLAHRNISNAVAEKLGVFHESPQAILLQNGKVVYTASHQAISASEMDESLTA